MRKMNHFSDEEWLDFVRKLMPPEKSAAMQLHVDKGCPGCTDAHSIWGTVSEIMVRQRRHEPDERDIAVAESTYAAWYRRYIVPRRARMARLVFDNFLAPLPAGVRAGGIQFRHLVHRMGPWTINLRLDSEGGGALSIVGQVLRSRPKVKAPRTVDVILVRGDTVVAHTSANQFGEFELMCEFEKSLQIYLDIAQQQPIGISLPDPTEQTTTG